MANVPANSFTSPNNLSPLDEMVNFKAAPNREQALIASQGWQGWTFDLADAAAAKVAVTSQTVHASAIALRGGQVIENILVACSTAAAGTAVTAANVGIANASGYVLANSASTTAATAAYCAAVGVNAVALTAALTVPADGFYFVYLWQNGTYGTTQPVFGAASASATFTAGHTLNGNLGTSITTVPNVANNGVGQTALTFSAATGPYYWFAVQ